MRVYRWTGRFRAVDDRALELCQFGSCEKLYNKHISARPINPCLHKYERKEGHRNNLLLDMALKFFKMEKPKTIVVSNLDQNQANVRYYLFRKQYTFEEGSLDPEVLL